MAPGRRWAGGRGNERSGATFPTKINSATTFLNDMFIHRFPEFLLGAGEYHTFRGGGRGIAPLLFFVFLLFLFVVFPFYSPPYLPLLIHPLPHLFLFCSFSGVFALSVSLFLCFLFYVFVFRSLMVCVCVWQFANPIGTAADSR